MKIENKLCSCKCGIPVVPSLQFEIRLEYQVKVTSGNAEHTNQFFPLTVILEKNIFLVP